MLSDLFLYSLRNLKNKKIRTWLTMIGIIIGITSVIALIGVGNGLREAVENQFGFVGADVLSIEASGGMQGPPGQGVVTPLDMDLVEKIESLSDIDAAFGSLVRTVKLEYDDILQIKFGQSVPNDNDKIRQSKEMLSRKTEKGRYLKEGDFGKVVLGNDYSMQSNGFDRAIKIGDSIKINDKDFRVVGILEKKGSFIVDGSFIIIEDDIRELIDSYDVYDLISARAQSKDAVGHAQEEIEKLLRKERDVDKGEENFEVTTSESSLQTIGSVLGGIQAFIVIIAAISMLVGSIGIVNTMFTSVLERTKEIGIMKAIGAKNSDIFSLFLIESGLLGAVGGIIGIIFGYLIALAGTVALSNFLGTETSPNISIMLIIITLTGSFIIGAVSGILPAMKAAKMAPVKALRG